MCVIMTKRKTFQECNISSQNINCQDWKYTSFVVFVRYGQNIRHHNAIPRDGHVADIVKIIGLKLQFSSWFSIHYIDFIIRQIQYINVSLLNLPVMFYIDLYLIEKVYSAKFFLYECLKHKWIETHLWKGNFNVFDDVCNKLVNCTATLNVLTVTDEIHKRCIFPILTVNVLWS